MGAPSGSYIIYYMTDDNETITYVGVVHFD